MARVFCHCTSAILFVHLGLAASIMLATSTPTAQRVYVRQATTSVNHLNRGMIDSVSFADHISVQAG